MKMPRDPEALMASWLDEGPAHLPMDTRQAIVVGVRTMPRRRRGIAWPTIDWRRQYAGLVGAAALVLVAVVALGVYFNGSGFGVGPSPTPSPSPTSSPTPSPSPTDGSLPAGTYVMDPGQEHGEDQITVTIPGRGWFAGPFTASLTKDLGNDNRVTLVVVSGDHYKVPRDICDWQTNPDLAGDRIADTLNQLVAFLMEQTYQTSGGSIARDFSPPVDITIDGYPAKQITSVVPLGGDRNQCDVDPSDGEFSQQRVFCSLQDRDSWGCQLANLGPGALDTIWIVDADQAWFRVIAATYSPSTSAELLAEMDAIVESAVFTQ